MKLEDTTNSSKAWHRYLSSHLEQCYSTQEATALAYALLEHFAGLSRAQVLADKPVSEGSEKLQKALSRLMDFEPLQYVTGQAGFYGRSFYVDPRVLIPRPETEELVAWVLHEEQDHENLRILDAGTGSGCIAVSLAAELRNAQVLGTDMDTEILALAEENARMNGVDVAWKLQDLNTKDENSIDAVDILVSNLPYVPERNQASMHPNVLHHEPASALFVPDDDPLLYYRQLLEAAQQILKPGGRFYAEIHEEMGKEVEQLIKRYGYTGIGIKKDIHGKDRMVKAFKA